MFYRIQADVYRWLREAAGLTQQQLADAAGLSRRTIQRIERGRKPPDHGQELAIFDAAGCTHRAFAELVARALSMQIDGKVTVLPEGAGKYRPTTPLAEVEELLEAGNGRLSQDRRWTWKARVGRVKTMSQVIEQESMAIAIDLKAELDRPPAESSQG